LSSEVTSVETEIWFQILVPLYGTSKRHIPQDGNLLSHYVLPHREKTEVLCRYHLVCLSDADILPAFYVSPPPRPPHFENGFIQTLLV
jgi:hypothetical protein